MLVGLAGMALLGASCLGTAAYARACSLDPDFVSEQAVGGAEEGEGRSHLELFKIINFFLLAGGLAFLLRKPLAEFFLQRSASIRKSLEEGRKALEASQAQLHAIEEKLGRLEEEIRALKDAATREMEAERERLRRATAEEVQKNLESVRAQVEAATRASVLELKNFAAQEALRLAEALIRERLDDSRHRQLVSRFLAQLTVNRTS